MSDDKGASRRRYGKGLFAGLSLAGIENPKEFMNAIKFRDIENGLTGIARKVYMAIPIGEAWERKQIAAELFRAGVKIESRAIDGCLLSLVESGIVRDERGTYRRVLAEKPRETKPMQIEKKPDAPTLRAVQKVAPADDSVLGKLAQIATDLRGKGDELHAKADEVDGIALWAEEQIQKSGEGASELKKLKAMLKSIME